MHNCIALVRTPLSWCHNGDYAEEDVFGHGKTTDVLLAKSIIRDLFAV